MIGQIRGGQGLPGHVFSSDAPPPVDPLVSAQQATMRPTPSAGAPSRQIVQPGGVVRFVSADGEPEGLASPEPTAAPSSAPAVVGQAPDGTTRVIGEGGVVRFVSPPDPAFEAARAAAAPAAAAPAPAAPSPAAATPAASPGERLEDLAATKLAELLAPEFRALVRSLETILETAQDKIHSRVAEVAATLDEPSAITQEQHEQVLAELGQAHARVAELEAQLEEERKVFARLLAPKPAKAPQKSKKADVPTDEATATDSAPPQEAAASSTPTP